MDNKQTNSDNQTAPNPHHPQNCRSNMQGQHRHAPVPAKMRALWLALLRQLYPNRCPVCDRVLFDAWICPSCDAKLKYVSQPVCFQCGKPLESSIQEYCSDCQKGRHHFIQGRAVFCYQGAVRGMLYRYKYAGRRDYSEFFAVQAAKRYADWARQRGIEMVLPIPLSKKRKRRRGYNQAEMFAKKFSELAGLPFDAKLLVRTRDTLPQKRLSARERKNNLKNAFKMSQSVVNLNKVLLIDDIYTTGSTIDAAVLACMQAGVREIYYLCISIGQGQ